MRAAFLLVLCACAHGVGFKSLAPLDPITGTPLKAIVFYPSSVAQDRTTPLGPYLAEAQEGLPAAGGKHPLVLISHGHVGTRFDHHDLATALARDGYLVAAVQHLGDSADDRSRVGTGRVWLERPKQVSALLDAVTADPELGARIDPARIGVIGYSAGGFTALQLVGAAPDPAEREAYCGRHPDSTYLCEITSLKPAQLAEAPPAADSRIKAAFVMAPLALLFGEHAFEAVKVPVFLAWAEKDHVLVPDDNAERVRTRAKTLAGSMSVPGADHWIFMAPCSAEHAKEDAMACVDAAGVDRVKVHRQLAEVARTFFDRAFR